VRLTADAEKVGRELGAPKKLGEVAAH
jgi:hypothetical protein